MIHLRQASLADLDEIMACYDVAKQFMRNSGNRNQWINGYPSRELIADDITSGVCHVGIDDDNKIAMVFAFIIGKDPTYTIIKDGDWPNSLPYGTIHRIASSGRYRGMLRTCIEFCLSQIDNIRLDTHADNTTMQKAALKLGFRRCGIIYCSDGSPRIAYQYTHIANSIT